MWIFQWTYFVRGLGVGVLVHEVALRAGALPERPAIILAAVGAIGLHEVYKRDKEKTT